MLEILVKTRNEKEVGRWKFSEEDTVDSVKRKVHETRKWQYPSRQWLTIGNDERTKIPLKDGDQKLSALVTQGKLGSGDALYLKDLGPQIGWKTVFHVEYFGPILIHSLFYFCPQCFYGGESVKPFSLTQKVAYWLVIIHYLKREYETHFVHRFSLETMPLFNIFKNSFHYWILCGLNIAYFLYHPQFLATKPDLIVYLSAAIFLFAESQNYACHMILRNLRPEGTKKRGIPKGNLFGYVACANYFWELLAWLVFAFFTQTLAAYFFFFVSFAQISVWAIKKAKLLKQQEREEGIKTKGRKVLIPFIF